MSKQKIINIAVIAHVDAGKSTLVDAFLNQSGVFRSNEEVVDCVMDSNDLERERGITIYAKNCSIMHEDVKINIVDTPGHADFSSEVERIIKTVDTVILLVDSSEGPMPQTRFVLQKSLEMGLKPILLINKIDKKDQRALEVVDMVYELFLDLNATDEQLDFPILYGIAKQGIVQYDMETPSETLEPLFKTIISHCDTYPDRDEEKLQLQVSALDYDEYIGRLGIGRVYKGVIREGQTIAVCDSLGNVRNAQIGQLFIYRGLAKSRVKEAASGEIVVFSGISNISIGETLCFNKDNLDPMEMISVEEPTLSMNFIVNKSPFAGQSGKYVTSRNLKERLEKELEVNVGLRVEETESADMFRVSGRGELHISILLENMRREGYEIAVSKPEVILHKENDQLMEPIEEVVALAPSDYSGTIINKLNLRKGQLVNMEEENGYCRIVYHAPTRGLLGYRSEFINDTHGEGTLVRRVCGYEPYKGEIQERANGALVSTETGKAMTYALWNIQERGQLFIPAQTEVYEGMIIGLSARNVDMDVNPIKNKKLTSIRSSGNDDAMKLVPPKILSLEEALEFINDDELVEITPSSIRLRKKGLKPFERKQYLKSKVQE